MTLRTGGISLALALTTFLVFLPVLWNDFVAWDDRGNLYENPSYRGLGWTQLKWMFTTDRLGHYIPLTWLSFGLDYVVWGMNPVGYHLTNLVLHAVGAVLLYFVARRLLQRATALSGAALEAGGVAAALFFAIHPLRVESVAWATERRDVLSGALVLLTVLLYLEAVEAGGARRRWLLGASVGAYLCALASKSIVMTLPLVLILLDVYPLRRLTASPRGWLTPSGRRVLKEKVPYVVLAVVGAVVAYYAQTHGAPQPASWPARLSNVVYSLWFYLVKTAIPRDLSPLYEAPLRLDPFEPRFLASGLGVAAASLLALRFGVRWPAGPVLGAYYVLVLAPVSGLIPMGFQLVADRYSYLSCLGWAVLVGAGVGVTLEARATGRLRPWLARLAIGVAGVWLVALGTWTWRQAQIWHDTERLWRHAVAVAPDCGFCHSFLGDSLIGRGAVLSGLGHLHRAAALRPDRVEFFAKLGGAFVKLGMWPEAEEQFRRVLARFPGEVDARNNLAVTLLQMGRATEAVEQLNEALRVAPDHVPSHVTLGAVLNELGDPAEAARHFRSAIELKPDAVTARLGLAKAYAALGRNDLAREQYELARTLAPPRAAGAGSGLAPAPTLMQLDHEEK